MSKKQRARVWNKYICPAIEISVGVIGMAALLLGLPILAILIFG